VDLTPFVSAAIEWRSEYRALHDCTVARYDLLRIYCELHIRTVFVLDRKKNRKKTGDV